MPTTGHEAGCFGARWRGEPLTASRLRLRALVPEDAPALAELAGDWAVARTTARIPHPLSEADALGLIEATRTALAQGDEVVLAMERLADGALVGCCGFRYRHGMPDAGYWLGRPYWGQGYALEALRRLQRLLFEDLGEPRISAEVLADNPASAQVLEKAGFVHAADTAGEEGRCAGLPMRRYDLEREAWRAWRRTWPTVLVAAVAMIDADGRLLLARRPEGKAMAGLWEFPGGKVHTEDGESPEAALVRELREELGVDITESCLAPLVFASHPYDSPGFHLLMPVFACRTWKGTPQPLEDQELAWVSPMRLSRYPMPPADLPLVPLLRDFLG